MSKAAKQDKARKVDIDAIGTRVRFKSFNGTQIGLQDGKATGSYWLLVGKIAEVLEKQHDLGRLLVRFDVSVQSLGLHCHNPIPNSLSVLESDLEQLL